MSNVGKFAGFVDKRIRRQIDAQPRRQYMSVRRRWEPDEANEMVIGTPYGSTEDVSYAIEETLVDYEPPTV